MSQDGMAPPPDGGRDPIATALPDPVIPPASREPVLLLVLGLCLFAALVALAWLQPRLQVRPPAVTDTLRARTLTSLATFARYHQARGDVPALRDGDATLALASAAAEEWLAMSRQATDPRQRGDTALNAAACFGAADRGADARAALQRAAARDPQRADRYRALLPLYAESPAAIPLTPAIEEVLAALPAGPLVRAHHAALRGQPREISVLLADGARAGQRILLVNAGVFGGIVLLFLAGLVVVILRMPQISRALQEVSRAPREDTPWGAGTALIVIGVSYLLAYLLGDLLRAQLQAGAPAHLVIALVTTVVGPLLALTLFLLALGRSPTAWSVLGWQRTREGMRFGLTVLLLLLPVVLITTILSQSLFGHRDEINPIIPELMATRDPRMLLLLTAATTLAAPVIEETLFRGLLFRALHARLPFWSAALSSGVLFALLHHQVAALLPITLLGVILALLARRTHSLLASVGAHAGYNGFVTLVVLLTSWALRGPGG